MLSSQFLNVSLARMVNRINVAHSIQGLGPTLHVREQAHGSKRFSCNAGCQEVSTSDGS